MFLKHYPSYVTNYQLVSTSCVRKLRVKSVGLHFFEMQRPKTASKTRGGTVFRQGMHH